MTGHRTFAMPPWPTFTAVATALLATGVLMTFPGDPRVWQAASWALACALLALLGLVPATGWMLARHREARTWPRMLGFILGALCLAAVALGAR